MITYTNLNQYRNGEFVKFMGNILDILKSYDLDTLQLKSLVDQLEAQYLQLKKLFKVDRGSNLTEELIRLDKLRDSLFSGLLQILNGHAKYNPEDGKKINAQQLYDIMLTHGSDLNRKSYQEQTGALDDIFAEIEEKGLEEQFAEFLLVEFYNQLKSTNTEFNTTFLARNKEYALEPQGNMQEMRVQVSESFYTLEKNIEARAILESTEAYQNIIKELNSLIDSYESNIQKRSANPSENDDSLDQDFDEVG